MYTITLWYLNRLEHKGNIYTVCNGDTAEPLSSKTHQTQQPRRKTNPAREKRNREKYYVQHYAQLVTVVTSVQ